MSSVGAAKAPSGTSLGRQGKRLTAQNTACKTYGNGKIVPKKGAQVSVSYMAPMGDSAASLAAK